ncbi:MAG: chromosome segregation SMC family protein [Bauldia sp.]
MKFTRLRLTGFKSFVEPTDVPIENGLTGIVGPNGCGKSNLAEGLLFVMGESSYKAMRGSAMEDVIFSGSGSRPSRNAAEVTVTLDNSDRLAPAGFNDSDVIEISRRIERENGSTYRLNGREVRARDVQLLFADASAGARSPAMVGQGRVGQLIAAKPEARRGILEEAAGISGLFGRRHEAELRLRAAEQNLERIEDVLNEIDRQLEALRRQARQAVRYRNLSVEIRKGEATALAVRYGAALAAAVDADKELDEITRTVAARAVVEAETAAKQAEVAATLPDLRDDAAAKSAALQRLRIELDQLSGEERSVGQKLGELERRLVQLAADLEREERLIGENKAALARLAAEDGLLAAESEGAAERRTEAAARVASAEAAVAHSERLSAEAQASLADIRARRSQIEREINDARARDKRLADDALSIDRERGQLAGSGGEARVGAASAAVTATERLLGEAEAAVAKAEAEAAQARAGEATARTAVTEAEANLATLEAEAKALRSVLPRNEVANPLADAVAIRDGAEAAVAALFGEELQLSTSPGVSYWSEVPATLHDPALPEGVEPLAALVDAPPVLARRIAQAALVDRADGPRLQQALHPGQSLVSREGDLWRWDGLVVTAEARRIEADRLAGRKRLALLGRRIEELRPTVQHAKEAFAAARDRVVKAGLAESGTRAALRNLLRELEGARATLAAAEREFARHGQRLAALDEAEARIRRGRNEAAAALAEAEAALAALPMPVSVEGPLNELRLKVAADRGVLAEMRAALAGLDREAQHRATRRSAIAAERAAWEKRQQEAGAQTGILGDRKRDIEAERAALAGRPAELAAQKQTLTTAIGEAESARNEAGDRLAIAEAALAAADKAAKTATAELAQARELRGRAEERLVGARQRLVEVGERIVEVLQCAPEEAAKAAGLGEGALPALDQIEARVDRLKQERERLGGVNLQAEDEAEQLADRRNGIIADRDDLVAAIQKLRQGIASLNREGRERLLAAFQAVDVKFRELFTQLFGGGTAELKLIGSEDPLEAGLEIIAKPPGKKPQTITLLSGGEQALTALSLIFAVFLTNPAPICVLDEVDAPLDDANVERFCSLLDDIASRTDTRFLVTTHNPITMARMSRLFGVTMAERGVSQLVSVDLATAERFREAG